MFHIFTGKCFMGTSLLTTRIKLSLRQLFLNIDWHPYRKFVLSWNIYFHIEYKALHKVPEI